jgi:hypothetical protein
MVASPPKRTPPASSAAFQVRSEPGDGFVVGSGPSPKTTMALGLRALCDPFSLCLMRYNDNRCNKQLRRSSTTQNPTSVGAIAKGRDPAQGLGEALSLVDTIRSSNCQCRLVLLQG